MALSVMKLVRVAICTISVLFCILALALPNWIVTTKDYNTPEKIHSGLWKRCDKVKDKDETCAYTSEGTAIENLSRAMVTIGVFLLFAALICAIMHFKFDHSKLGYVAGIMSAIAGLCLLITFSAIADLKSVMTDNLRENSKTSYAYGAAFALDIVAWLLAWVQAVLFIIPQSEYVDPSSTP